MQQLLRHRWGLLSVCLSNLTKTFTALSGVVAHADTWSCFGFGIRHHCRSASLPLHDAYDRLAMMR
jgi:hypothetical protein